MEAEKNKSVEVIEIKKLNFLDPDPELNLSKGTLSKIKAEVVEIKVSNPEDLENYEIAKKYKRRLVSLRTNVLKRVKETNEPLRAMIKNNQTIGDKLEEEIRALESHLTTQLKIVDDEQARKKQEAEEAKAKRTADRIARMNACQATYSMPYLENAPDDAFEVYAVDCENLFKRKEDERIQSEKEAAEKAAAEANAKKELQDKLAAAEARLAELEAKSKPQEVEPEPIEVPESHPAISAAMDYLSKAVESPDLVLDERQEIEDIKREFATYEAAILEIVRLRKLI